MLPLTVMAFLFGVMPWFSAVPAGLFLWGYRRTRSRLCLLAALCWLVYLPYETAMYLRILCTGECNIRIDLLLIYPLLLLVSLLAAWAAWRRRSRPAEGQDTSS